MGRQVFSPGQVEHIQAEVLRRVQGFEVGPHLNEDFPLDWRCECRTGKR